MTGHKCQKCESPSVFVYKTERGKSVSRCAECATQYTHRACGVESKMLTLSRAEARVESLKNGEKVFVTKELYFYRDENGNLLFRHRPLADLRESVSAALFIQPDLRRWRGKER